MKVCAAPLRSGPNKGKPATGTNGGYRRHRNANEPPCNECRAAEVSRVQAWSAANPERRLETSRRWREANPEAQREAERRWRAINADKARMAVYRWNAANPERKREYIRSYRARKASVLTIPFTTDQLAQRMAFWSDRCWMCGGDFEEVDHVIPIFLGGPHCLSNLRPACKSCNTSKGARHYAEVA